MEENLLVKAGRLTEVCNECFFLFTVAPSVDVYPVTVVVLEGGNVTLRCNASGIPVPVTRWTLDGTPVAPVDTPLLTVVNVSRPGTPDEIIQYQCTASNGVENPAIATVNVTVHCEYRGFKSGLEDVVLFCFFFQCVPCGVGVSKVCVIWLVSSK